MTKQEFSKIAMAIKTYYPNTQILPNNAAMELWYQQLQDIPYNVCTLAVNKWVAINKWSPTIADIREYAAGIGRTGIRLVRSVGRVDEEHSDLRVLSCCRGKESTFGLD